jgi:hypothetical protein
MKTLLERYEFLRSPDEGGASLPAPSGVDTSASGSDADFDMPLGDNDLDTVIVPDEGAGASPTPSPTGVVESAALPQAAAPAPSPQPQVSAPTAPPGPQVSPAQAAQPASAQNPAEQSQELSFAEQWAQGEESLISSLAERYAISEADAEMLATNPEQVLPRLAARVLYDAIASVHKQLSEFGPQMIQGHMARIEGNRKNEADFFNLNPGLKDITEEQKEAIGQIALLYRKMNPQASREQVLKDVGLLAHQKFGIAFQNAQPQAAKPPKANGSFRPAASVLGAGAVPQSGASDDPWAGFDNPNSGDDS